jgi:Asp-tRNA(Asn)/Glu-tRNA(Gln) amidotransferase A subunit family amidase
VEPGFREEADRAADFCEDVCLARRMNLMQNSRKIEIDGKTYPYRDQSVWPSIATAPGLPSTVAPIDRGDSSLPIGVQIVGPYLEDRTTIAFAGHIEREFGGFINPLLQATMTD